MKAFFLSRLLREKLLLVVLLAAGMVMWLSSVSNRVKAFWQTASLTSTELKTQKQVLAERSRIEAQAKAAVAQLDPARTYNSVRLQAEVYAIARNAGITSNNTIDDAQTLPGPQFSINTVRFSVRNSDWDTLRRFYEDLSKHSPYIGIEEFSLSANAANPRQLTALLRVSSVEITRRD